MKDYQVFLAFMASAFAVASAKPDAPRRWRIWMLVFAAVYAALLLITMWRLALLGG